MIAIACCLCKQDASNHVTPLLCTTMLVYKKLGPVSVTWLCTISSILQDTISSDVSDCSLSEPPMLECYSSNTCTLCCPHRLRPDNVDPRTIAWRVQPRKLKPPFSGDDLNISEYFLD